MNNLIINMLRWDILNLWLPVAVLAAAAFWTALLIRRDRYQRKLTLLPSPEEQRIRALAANGAIDSRDVETLLAGCHVLPEVRESVPLPDLSLKLVSAFGRIYSVMKIVMLAGVAATIGALELYLNNPENGATSELHSEKLPFLLTCAILVFALAIGEFIAAVKILHGSLRARNFLIFSWIVNFLLIRTMLSPFDSTFCCILTAGCGFYTLYVLLFRHNARQKISSTAGETPRNRKIIFGICATAALTAGLTLFSAQSNPLYEDFATMETFRSSVCGSLHFEMEKVVLIPGTPDRETAELCTQLARVFQSGSGPACEIRRYGETVPVDDLLQTLPVVVTRVEYLPPAPVPETLISALPVLPEAATANSLQEVFLRKMKSILCFRIETATGNDSTSFLWQGLSLTENNLIFSGTFLAATTTAEPAKKSLERISSRMAKRWDVIRKAQREKPAVKLLPFPNETTAPRPPDLDLSGFSNATALFIGHGKNSDIVALYRFAPPRSVGERQNLIRLLESQGFRKEGNSSGEIIRFEKEPPAIRLELRFPETSGARNGIRCRRPHGELFYRRAANRPEPIDHAFLKRFAAADPRAFTLLGGIRWLSAADRRATFAAVLRGGPLSLTEKLIIWQYLAWQKSPEPEFDRFFHTLATEVLDDFAHPDYLAKINTLLDSTKKLPEKQAFLLERLSPIRKRVQLSAPPGKNGIVTQKLRIRRSPLLPSRLLLDLEIPEKPLLRTLVSLTEMPDKTLNLRMDQWGAAKISRPELSRLTFSTRYTILSGEWWSNQFEQRKTFSNRNSIGTLEPPPEPGEIVIQLQFDENSFEYRIRVDWKPELPPSTKQENFYGKRNIWGAGGPPPLPVKRTDGV